MLQKLKSSAFIRKITVLSLGTLIGQAILVGVTPLLSRIYTPSDFAVLGLLVTFFGVLGIISSLRYELLFPLAKTQQDFNRYLILNLAAVGVLGSLLSMGLLVGGHALLRPFGMELLAPYIWLLIPAFFIISLYNVFNLALTCIDEIKLVSGTKVSQAANSVTVQLVLGVLVAGPLGLLLGFVVSQASGVNLFMRHLAGRIKSGWQATSAGQLWSDAKLHWQFPLYSTPSGVLSRMAAHIPLPLIAAYYGAEVAGFYVLGQRLLAMPMVLVGRSVAQVFVSEFGRRRVKGDRKLHIFFVKISAMLLALGAPFMLVLMLLGPWAFSLVFGSQWEEAGYYARLLAPMFVAQFAIAPLAQALNLSNRQLMQLVWDVFRLVVTSAAVIVPYYYNLDARQVMMALSATMTASYMLQLAMIYYTLRTDSAGAKLNKV